MTRQFTVLPGGKGGAGEERPTDVLPVVETANDTHYEHELDVEPSPDAGKPVYAEIAVREHEHRPIIPASLRKGNRKSTAHTLAGRILHRIGYHAVRTPWYTALAIWWAPVGLFRIVWHSARWAFDLETMGRALSAKDEEAIKFMEKADKHRRHRLPVFFGVLGFIVLSLPILLFLTPLWVKLLVIAVALPPLAKVGVPVDKRIVHAAVVAPRFRKLNPDIVLRAYYAAGLGHPDKPGQQIQFGSVMSRDGEGSAVIVDLPYGKTFADAIKAKASIASGLDVKIQQVYITEDNTSNRRHRLWVADRDPLAVPAGRTPLLDCKPRNIWRPAPFGLDERGRKVNLLMLWISILVGAQPRKGKTFSARLLALYAALDPYTKLTVVDGKNSPDWRKFSLVAHRIIFGTTINRDGDPVDMLLEALREIKEHIQSVNAFLSSLPVDQCPDGKLTEELSRQYPQLRVWVLVMEEFQVYFELDDQETNKEVASLLSFIMAVGPSSGVIILSSSQKPSGVGAGDVQRLFNRYRDNHAVRFALKCGNRLVSEAVLGGDAYAEGFDAASLPVGPQYRGVGYLYGASDDTPTVRTYLADAQDAEKILLAARLHRERAGTLTGMAAGENMARAYRDVLYDVQRVFYPGEEHISWRLLAARLQTQIPEAYADLTQDAISSQVRQLNVASVNVRDAETGDVAKGCKLAAINQAVERRAIESGSGSGTGGRA
jgi:S-DNA-T family DNA segregation ATPase FtsK/SpoIIIE